MSETGQLVYDRTYSRVKPDGTKENWNETVQRVVDGNLALVDSQYQIHNEREDLIRLMTEFKIIPAGRHLWASGVPNGQHLFNCWTSHWTDNPSDHFEFTFLRLMEGGGVGANYSNRYLDYPDISSAFQVHIVCDREHRDYGILQDAGVLSDTYDSDWSGSFVIEDSRQGWAEALVDLIDTYYREDASAAHVNRVYDVSRVRPSGAKLKTFGGTASGPLPLAKMLQDVSEILNEVAVSYSGQLDGMSAMEIDHAIAQCVVAGGVRRSARMALMHWDDPQIFDFLSCKRETGSHWTTNISVEVDDEFWNRVHSSNPSTTVESAHAWEVLDLISKGAVLNGEPGMWDSSYNNNGEPQTVYSCNPCSEIALLPWEPCNLGHINLAAFVSEDGWQETEDLHLAHELMTRFLIRATFAEVGDARSREVLDKNRRIGVGHLGVASYLALVGIKLSDAPYNAHFRLRLSALADEVSKAARELCHQLRIPLPVKSRTIAPTGTISKMPGVSEGIHPIYARYFIRRIRFSKHDPDQMRQVEQMRLKGYELEDDLYAADTVVVSIPTKDSLLEAVEKIHGEEKAQNLVQSTGDLSLHQMLSLQALYQELWADNAISFTANIDPDKYTADNVKHHLLHFAGKLKGTTIFPDKSRPQSPYQRIEKEEYEASLVKEVADGVDTECSSGACPIR